MLDWNVSSSQQRDRLTHNGAFTLSGPLLYGVLSARGNARFSPDEGMHLNVGGYQWRFSVPELPAVQSFGVSFSPGTNVGAVGFGVSNSSVLDVRAQTTTRTIEGTTEPGWDVELYDGQDLVDAVRTDSTGRYAFEVSMIASRSDRTIVFRGPNGERIVETRHLQAGSGVIPVGELRYGLNAYTSGISDTVPVSGDLTMTLGVTDRVSVGLDTRVSSRSLRGLALEDADVQLKAAIDFGDQTPVTLKVSPRSGVFGGTVQFVPFGDGAINVSADSVHVVDGTYLVGVSSGVSLGPVTLAGGGRVYNLSDRFGFDISPIAFARILGVTISSSLRYAYEEVEVIGERTPSDEPRTKLLGRLGVSFSPVRRVHLRTGMSYDFMRRAIDESSASIGLSLIRGVGLDVTYSMRGTDWRNGRLGAGLNFGLPFATATVYSSYDQEELIVRSRLSGSAALSLADLEIDGSGNGTRSAIEVRGYNDRNHNGMWDSGEEALGPVRADLFNGQGERTGSGVDFYGLAPYRECIVVIDHNQFAEVDLFPRRSRYRFAQMPSSVEIIEVPFDVGRDLIGRCQIVLDGRLGNPAVMLGSRVALVAVDGSARYDGEFFQDGTCLLSGVAPGEYRIVFDDAQLAARRLEVAEMPATVTVDETLEELPMVSLTVVATESTPVETGGH
jgi:hypothetical protein